MTVAVCDSEMREARKRRRGVYIDKTVAINKVLTLTPPDKSGPSIIVSHGKFFLRLCELYATILERIRST